MLFLIEELYGKLPVFVFVNVIYLICIHLFTFIKNAFRYFSNDVKVHVSFTTLLHSVYVRFR